MITKYMEDLEIDNPFSHYKAWERNPYEKAHGKNIYKNKSGKYYIEKTIKGEVRHWGTYDTFQEALRARDEIILNDWVKEATLEDRQRAYYKYVYLKGRKYMISKKNHRKYVNTIEEALYYRDICMIQDWIDVPNPHTLDLETDNPYSNGLDYPLPERLVIPGEEPRIRGSIVKSGEQAYIIIMGSRYYGCYRTYEMAYYVKQELNKCNWDKSQLDRIIEEYPVWYTWLMNFYQYVIPKSNGWIVNITQKHSDEGRIEHLHFSRLEDALWERDLMTKYDWNEELMIECADDSLNPYYDMDLPPYPQRKVRRIQEREPRTGLFNRIYELVNEEYYTIHDICSIIGLTDNGLRSILRNEYDISMSDFMTLCRNGINPNDVLEQKPIIYKPNLDIMRGTNYVAYYKNEKTPYIISHKNKDHVTVYFGAYPSRELANKISDDLQKCGWDKSRLKEIQARHGWQSTIGSRNFVYPKHYTSKRTGERYVRCWEVYKKTDGKKVYYGAYKDKRVAELIRDLLVSHDWDKSRLDEFKDYAGYCISMADKMSNRRIA